MAAFAEPCAAAGQKAKTRAYWDAFYAARGRERSASRAGAPTVDEDVEWIVPAAPEVVDAVLGLFPPSLGAAHGDRETERGFRVLEIGCGVSRLSSHVLRRLLLRHRETAPSARTRRRAYDFVATDVSSTCIEQNRIRDDSFVASLDAAKGSLRYEPLDVLDQSSPVPGRDRYEVVLDKGTLDTFLFRSKRTNKRSAPHPPLLAPLLNNVHRWLRGACGAKYIIISPRRKIKSVRDFRGFASVRRTTIHAASRGGGALLVQGNGERAARPASAAYLYECARNDDYDPDRDAPYSAEGSPADDAACRKCGMTFAEFRGRADVRERGDVACSRRWKNHGIHCK